jgi:hypothetical protein
MSTYKHTDLIDAKGANAYIVEKRINSIVSELHIAKMNMADVVDKINGLFSKKELVSELTEDQRIYLLAANEHYMKEIDYADELIKKL